MVARIAAFLFFATLAVVVSGCSQSFRGLITSSSPRIWVIRTTRTETVYRCAEPDTSGPPRPVCVEAPLHNSR